MRVGLNLLPIGAKAGGIGTHARALPAALLEAEPGIELTVAVSREATAGLTRAPWAGDVRWLRLPVGTGGRPQMAAQLAGLPAIGLARRWDVLHSVANVGPPRVPGLPSVTTVHDFIWLHAGTDWGTPEAIAAMRRVAVRSARWATRVQADSQATADDLRALAGLDASRVDVVPLGAAAPGAAAAPEAALRERLDLADAPVVLTVAQKRPYKNLGAAVRALASVPEARLVLPGEPTPYEDELRALAAELGVADRVRFPGWLEEDELEGLYGLAACVLIPSRFEGFGLPVLEAMLRGAPVACADALSLPEVAGDAALLFDPLDQASIDAAVVALVRDPALRARLAAAGRERAAGFTWRRTAELTLAGYRRAAGQ